MKTTLQHEKQVFLHARFGVNVSWITALVTIITFAIAILTPPLAGPFCREGCIEYPYTDILSRFPRDYYWMVPSLLIWVLFVLLMVTLHHYAGFRKKLYSQISLSLAIVASAILIPNYFIQLTVVQPSLVLGETQGLALLTQYNPHGIFIALEEIGLLLVCTAFMAMVPAMDASTRLTRSIRFTWTIAFALAILSLILITLQHGIMREYYFEVAVISIVYLELIITSILLALLFRKEIRKKS